jgi:DNA gyrase subunit B
VSGSYGARDIAVLRGLEAVRRRPAMYIGSTGPDGVLHLLREVVHNALDEALAGHGTTITVTRHTDGSWEVEDDGRGIPVDAHPLTGRPALELVLTTLHAGGKFAAGAYHAPGGLHGVGLACVNALSEHLEVHVTRDGHVHRVRCERGEIVEPCARRGDATGHGTRLRFRPDATILGDEGPEVARVVALLRAQAFLVPGLTLRLVDGVSTTTETFRDSRGVAGFVDWLDRARVQVHAEPVVVEGTRDGVDVAAALRWTRGWSEDLHAFVNGIPTPQGGPHLEGLKRAVLRALEPHAAPLLDAGEQLAALDVREGLTAVLSIRMAEPAFDGQAKAALASAEAGPAVEEVVQVALEAALRARPELAAAVLGRALEAARARNASRRASERARYRRMDLSFSREVYREQFGIRSKNWHQSARWITDSALLGLHADACRVAPDARVLDVCCGSGVVGASFRGRVGHVTGLDLTPEMVALARTRLDEVVQGDVYAIPFPEGSYDLVVNREVLHLLPYPERPVAEVFRVLRPGGQFIVGQLVPYGAADAPWFFRVVKKKQPLFYNNLTAEDMRRLLEDAGFVDVTMTETVQWEDIDTWIDTWETPAMQRAQIRDLYHHAPAEVRAAHPFEIGPDGRIRDGWRWCVFSGFKP